MGYLKKVFRVLYGFTTSVKICLKYAGTVCFFICNIAYKAVVYINQVI